MKAESSISFGNPRINCTSKNMKKASVAKNFGTMIGRNVFIQPKDRKMMYRGIVVTWVGNIRVIIIIANQNLFPINLRRAKAYAVREQKMAFAPALNRQMVKLFLKKVSKPTMPIPAQPLL
jgi:hypothetical protein